MTTPVENLVSPPDSPPVAAPDTRAIRVVKAFRRQTRLREFLPAGLLVLTLLIFSLITPAFFSVRNFANIADQSAVIIIAGMGLTLVILAGSIDLSVGSVAGLAAVIAASFATSRAVSGLEWIPDVGSWSILIGLAVGVLIGLISGSIFATLRVPSFVVTLGVLTLVAGLQVVWTSGTPIAINDPFLLDIGFARLFGVVPLTFIIALLCVALCVVLARFTPFGRFLYALGGNERVAVMSAIPVTRVKIAMFGLSGGFAALAGILEASRNGSATPSLGGGLELMAIAAVVIGGTPLTGGTGGPIGTLIGALIITALSAGLNIVGVPPQWSPVITGLVLIVAVIVSTDRKRIGIIK